MTLPPRMFTLFLPLPSSTSPMISGKVGVVVVVVVVTPAVVVVTVVVVVAVAVVRAAVVVTTPEESVVVVVSIATGFRLTLWVRATPVVLYCRSSAMFGSVLVLDGSDRPAVTGVTMALITP